jgi:hypothetical protein
VRNLVGEAKWVPGEEAGYYWLGWLGGLGLVLRPAYGHLWVLPRLLSAFGDQTAMVYGGANGHAGVFSGYLTQHVHLLRISQTVSNGVGNYFQQRMGASRTSCLMPSKMRMRKSLPWIG